MRQPNVTSQIAQSIQTLAHAIKAVTLAMPVTRLKGRTRGDSAERRISICSHRGQHSCRRLGSTAGNPQCFGAAALTGPARRGRSLSQTIAVNSVPCSHDCHTNALCRRGRVCVLGSSVLMVKCAFLSVSPTEWLCPTRVGQSVVSARNAPNTGGVAGSDGIECLIPPAARSDAPPSMLSTPATMSAEKSGSGSAELARARGMAQESCRTRLLMPRAPKSHPASTVVRSTTISVAASRPLPLTSAASALVIAGSPLATGCSCILRCSA